MKESGREAENPEEKRTRGSGKEGESRREGDERNRKRGEAPEERLWERIREGRKETNREAEYRNREGTHEKSGGRERGKPKERK